MRFVAVQSYAIAALVLVPAGLTAMPATPKQAVQAVQVSAPAARQPAPMFSSPTYLPLRAPARVSCVKDNCRLPDGRVYHNDWAIDFLGAFGDPVHPAGYGVAHVGGRVSGCRDRSEDRGNWVWIDHGGGEITRYYHLQKILVRDGERVTPDTKIGEMGGTGVARCRVAYLHFERRITNKDSRLVEPAAMWACATGRPVRYPQAAGYNTWNMPKLTRWVRSGGLGCVDRPPRASRPTLTVARSTRARDGIVMRWQPPVENPHLVTRYRVFVSLWHPTPNRWDSTPEYLTVPGKATTFTVPGLQARRTYRVKIAAMDRAGASPWSKSSDVIIARPPPAPPITKLRATARTVYAKWTCPTNGGNRITRFVAELRRGRVVVRRSETYPGVRNVTWTGLARHTRYQVAVVAVNQVGSSEESVRRITTR